MTDIIEVDFKPKPPEDPDDPELRIKRKWQSDLDHKCSHKYCTVDEKLRIVTCRDCSITLDPIEVIIGIARDWEGKWNKVKKLVADARHYQDEVDKIKRAKVNLQAQLRRVRAKPEAVEAAAALWAEHYKDDARARSAFSAIRRGVGPTE